MQHKLSGLPIEPINRRHVRDAFDCGEATLNDYLHRYARQNDENNIARSFVAVDAGQKVIGYYAISAASIEFEQLPEAVRKRLPQYPIPAARLGRLAIDKSAHGLGLGAHLLIDALQRITLSAAGLGIKVILVDAIHAQAAAFYQQYGFIPLPGNEFSLFLPIETVARLFEA